MGKSNYLRHEKKMDEAHRKKPMISRYQRVARTLECSLFNFTREYIDTSGMDISGRIYSYVSLFSGAGGFSLGFKTAGYAPLLSAEIDPDASATYRRNFPESHHNEGPIQTLTDEGISKIIGDRDVQAVCAGFPCQGFSIAGDRRVEDKRNTLYKEVVRVARQIRPWFVVMENVPGVATMDSGRVVQSILRDFKELGYPDMSVLILESAAYGVPQIRPRAIFVGNRFGLKNPFPKPILEPDEYIPIEAAIDDLKLHPRDPSINHEWTRHSSKMEKRLAKVPPGGSLYESYFDAWKRQYRGVPSMTIKENHGGVHIHYELNRTISAREMARLQSFPDSFIFAGRMKRVMWQVGNAVPPLLAKHVALALRPSLERIQSGH
jgi:DNA (cytosine-5)-methyltransferase 1